MISSVLVLADDPQPEQVHHDLLSQATAETLRACFHASSVTLVPALPTILPLAAVIARSLRATERDRDEPPEAEHRNGRFVLYRGEDDPPPPTEWFPIEDLGGPIREAGSLVQTFSAEEALRRHPPDTVVALSPRPAGAALLSRLESPPRVLFFSTLLGDRLGEFLKFFGRWDPVDLERHWLDREKPDDDPETGRSDDDSLEPFVPFGLLVQLELWPEGSVGRER
jgi:hypothetical protein